MMKRKKNTERERENKVNHFFFYFDLLILHTFIHLDDRKKTTIKNT